MKFFSVAQIKNNTPCMISNQTFDNYLDAEYFMNDLIGINPNFNYYIFESNAITEECSQYLDSMKFENYGKGYLLRCLKKNPIWGTKYLLDGELSEDGCGWWIPSAKGWFFKDKFKSDLINLGATEVS